MTRRLAFIIVAWLAAGTALMVVFLAYQRPELAVDLANQLWSCF